MRRSAVLRKFCLVTLDLNPPTSKGPQKDYQSRGFREAAKFSQFLIQNDLIYFGAISGKNENFIMISDIEFKENTILEVKSGILIMESKIKNKKNIVGIINENDVINLTLCNYENIKLIALTNCEIKTIKRGLFFSSTDLLTRSLKRIDQLEKLLLIRDIKKSEEKLKEFLLYLSSIIGFKKDKHIYLNLKEFNFTHKIIGNSISSTRVTVTRNLKILEKKGWLKFKKKGILIPFKDN